MIRARFDLNSETTTSRATSADQERLARILDDYLVAVERGQTIDLEELLSKYPDDAAQLRGYLSGLQLFHAAALGTKQESSISSSERVPPALEAIGDYRLIREIGRGGMGIVYEAWQVSLRRRVALKVLPFNSASDAKQLGRFKNEAQAAAQVQHPNIVPVFAVGEENGVHYYVMQLIEGQSLAGLLGAMRTGTSPSGGTTAPNNLLTQRQTGHELRIGPSRSPSAAVEASKGSGENSQPMRANETADHIRVVARLGVQAADALHAAHEYGILHRDVKPSNLLLDDQGKLWITDFGLARCRDVHGLTQTGDVLGTMRYMSPEQALGRNALIDQRTDVYSLGLTMYELATLHHPADEVSDVQLLFDRYRPVAKPLRHWNRHIPADFQTIVLKCMAEFPHERYASARELAADLERFLDGRPILASPPGWLSRAGKWAKRRRGVVYAAAAVLLVAIGGMCANMMVVAHERAERVRMANDAMHDMGIALDRLNRTAVRLSSIPGAEEVRYDLLRECVQLYQKFAQQAVDDPTLANDVAITYGKLGILFTNLGQPQEARKAHEQARGIWQQRLTRDPENAEHARMLARSLNSLGLLAAGAGQRDEAFEHLHQALELQSRSADDTTSLERANELATTHSNLGVVLKTSSPEQAVAEFQAAIAIWEPFAESAGADPEALQGLVANYTWLAAALQDSSPSAAENAYQRAIHFQLKLAKSNPINRIYRGDLARAYNNLGMLALKNDEWKKAETYFSDAIRLQQELVKASPGTKSYPRDLAICYNNLGMIQSRDGRLADAEQSYQRAAQLQQQLLAAEPNDVQVLSSLGSTWSNLGMLFDRQQKYVEGAAAYEQAVRFQRRALGIAPTNTVTRGRLSGHYSNYARNQSAQGRYEAAVKLTADRKNLWPADAKQLLSVLQDLTLLWQQINGAPDAEQAKQACVETAAQAFRAALAAGISRDQLQDPKLAVLMRSEEFRQLTEDAGGELTATSSQSSK
jgi:serine/threonine protein kinase/Tfp pilus assembly protein PilF